MKLLLLSVLFLPVLRADPFRIEVVDKENGWPVPLVELTTTNDVALVTDNAGVAAFALPELMGRETWLHVSSHGYELPADGFGNRGVRIHPKPGGSTRIEVGRKQIAKRLGRLTGGGQFAESQLTGTFMNWKDTGVMGSDTVQLARYRGKLFWLWGDTNLPGYPLGIFHTSAATSSLNPLVSLKPPTGIAYDYFRNRDGQPRGVAQMAGDGPTWLSGFVALPDGKRREHLVATYAKIGGGMAAYEFGLLEWNDTTENFDKVSTFWKKSDGGDHPPKPYPDGHPVFWTDHGGNKWLYFNGPPNFRCPATYEAWRDRSTWETVENPKSYETVDGQRIEVASAAVAWSGYRKRFVMIVQQKFGKPSTFGEVWYLEGESPQGPWGPAIKVATHQNYTFYNVQIDWQLADPDKPVLLFEGTYTTSFTDNKRKTPRYDYNQVLYRLDLDDPALKPAQAD
ncbi:hypothetical protein [Luteolibacter marinus]|uniref:hypothetical protein n=1 Tax=Luteolibacter marinus TaxID=2776705 RepID=UPI001865C409|nr:hypothetical protein [Luteolibacter marinus]